MMGWSQTIRGRPPARRRLALPLRLVAAAAMSGHRHNCGHELDRSDQDGAGSSRHSYASTGAVTRGTRWNKARSEAVHEADELRSTKSGASRTSWSRGQTGDAWPTSPSRGWWRRQPKVAREPRKIEFRLDHDEEVLWRPQIRRHVIRGRLSVALRSPHTRDKRSHHRDLLIDGHFTKGLDPFGEIARW